MTIGTGLAFLGVAAMCVGICFSPAANAVVIVGPVGFFMAMISTIGE